MRRRGQKHDREKVQKDNVGVAEYVKPRLTAFWGWAIALAMVAGFMHSMHIAALFENDRFFSHLSPLERELSFRTEMGMYYSYYKRMVEAPTLVGGVASILHDNLTEYPATINTLQRFNLYPEVCLSVMFRGYRWLLGVVGVAGVNCQYITRGYEQGRVQACNGLGDPTSFYVHMIFALNGVMASAISLLGTYLSGSVWGGVVSLTAFFYNHGQSTRVMWTPPLRESFAMPFLLLQTLILSLFIRRKKWSLGWWAGLVLATLALLLPWQFSQFTLLSQVMAVLVVHCLRLLPSHVFLHILSAIAVAFGASAILQFGNIMLLTSFLPACLLSCTLVCLVSKLTNHLKYIPLIMLVEVCVVMGGSVMVKMILSALLGSREDEHILAILLTKFTSYHDFHTKLYTCAAEFDFLPLSYVLDITWTLLLPMSVVTMVMLGMKTMHSFWRKLEDVATPLATPPAVTGDQLYHLMQTLAFVVMATLIMRLKLFLSPQLAILCGFLPSLLRASGGTMGSRYKWVLAGLLVLSSLRGWSNLHQQHSILGEYNNPEGEELVLWIRDHTHQSAVFAGTMPTMAMVLLTTGRAVVNHPHYETAQLRNQTKHVYSIFSRKSAGEVHSILLGMRVQYVISEDGWCGKHRKKPGCSFGEMWDEEDPGNQGKPIFCETIQKYTPRPFKLLFLNSVYRVLQVASGNHSTV